MAGFIAKKGSKRAVRLCVMWPFECQFCKRKTGVVYYFHSRLICIRCVPEWAEILHVDKVKKYKVVKID